MGSHVITLSISSIAPSILAAIFRESSLRIARVSSSSPSMRVDVEEMIDAFEDSVGLVLGSKNECCIGEALFEAMSEDSD